MFHELNLTRDLKIVRLDNSIGSFGKTYHDLKTLIEECDDLYPGIDIWCKQKVKPGLISKERTALVVYHNSSPIGAAVLKKGTDAKLCSLRILPAEQYNGLGQLMIALLAVEIRHGAQRVHFTIPQQLWTERQRFFENYGFVNNGPASIQYRLFDEELSCSANFDDVWKTVLKKLPATIEKLTLNENSSHCDLVLSIKPTHAQKIVSGNKRIEIRRKFSKKWKGASALIYASNPRREFIGEAVIGEIITGSPEKIWINWGSEIGCTAEEFTFYCKGASEVNALILTDVKPFKIPILLTQIQHLIQQDLIPPQSHLEVKKDTIWPVALSLSCLLRGAP